MSLYRAEHQHNTNRPIVQVPDDVIWYRTSGNARIVQVAVATDRPKSQREYTEVLCAVASAQPLMAATAEAHGERLDATRSIAMSIHRAEHGAYASESALTHHVASQQQSLLEADYEATTACPLHVDLIEVSDARQIVVLGAPAWCADLASLCLLADWLLGKAKHPSRDSSTFADVVLLLAELRSEREHEDARAYWVDEADTDANYRFDMPGSTSADLLVAMPQSTGDAFALIDEAGLLACWQYVLERQFGAAAVIACAVSPRDIDGIDSTFGPLTWNVPLRLTPASGSSFAKRRLEVLEQLDAARANCLFFEDAKRRDGSPLPGWRFGFDFGSLPVGLEVLRNDRANCGLRLSVTGIGSERTLRIVFDERMHDRDDIYWLGQHFQQLLKAASQTPDRLLKALSGVATDHMAWLHETSAGAALPALAPTFVDRFREVVAKRGKAPALHADSAVLSYAELDRWTNQVARFLQEEGAQPGDRIGICMPRTKLQLAALLAVLKLGATYVPIDPLLPAKRIAAIVSQARIGIIMTDSGAVDRVSELDTEVPLLNLEQDIELIETLADLPLAVDIHPEQGAYLIFTSGSTGTPKGVEVSHRALMNYVTAIGDRLTINEYESLCALSTVAADLGYTAVFGALGHGCCLRLVDESLSLDAAGLAEAFEQAPVDCLKIVPSHLQALLALDDPIRLLPRKCIVFGGEALPWDLVAKLRGLAPNLLVLNHYGPTETTIGIVCNTELRHAVSGFGVPLGKPLGNCQTYVVDQDFELCPVGVEGDLVLAGSSVSNGYFDQPAETARRFLPNPFSTSPGARLYVSGDRGRWNGQGQLCFLGRADHQVKIRGNRVELGEIEATVRSTGLIRDCVAVVTHSGSASRLVAYVVGEPASEAILRSHLSSRMPDYMCPSCFVWLERLPLNANGKIDRRALPDPDLARQTSRDAENPIEVTLLAICRQLLANDRIGVEDNFFAVGADSIVAIQLVARARQAGYAFRPKQVFEQQTIARLAAVVQYVGASTESDQGEVTGLAPLSPIQARFFAKVDVHRHQYNQSVLYDLDPSVQLPDLRAAVDRLLSHHDGLRVTFLAESNGQWRQRFHSHRPEWLDLCVEELGVSLTEATVAALASERHARFDLSRGPLVRFTLLRDTGGANLKLLVVAHHLLVDTFSWGVLEEDLRSLLTNPGVALLPKTASTKAVAERLFNAYGNTGEHPEHTYWQRVLAGLPRLPILPGEDLVGDASSRHLACSKQLCAALAGDVHSRFNTNTQDFLLAALLASIGKWSGTRDVGVMLEAHGRDGEDLGTVDRTIGWFTTMFPLLLTRSERFDRGQLGAELVIAVKEQIRAVPSQGSGYAQTIYLPAQGTAVPVLEPEICFNYLGRFPVDTNADRQATAALQQAVQNGTRSPHQPRQFAIEVLAMHFGEQLVCNFVYNPSRVSPAVMDELVSNFERNLEQLVGACSAAEGTLTPSDVPDLNLAQHDLDALLSELSEMV